MSTTNRQAALEAISFFESYFPYQHARSQTQEQIQIHIRNLKHFLKHSKHINLDLVHDAQNMHYSLGEIVRKLENETI